MMGTSEVVFYLGLYPLRSEGDSLTVSTEDVGFPWAWDATGEEDDEDSKANGGA